MKKYWNILFILFYTLWVCALFPYKTGHSRSLLDPPIIEDNSFTMVSDEQWDVTAVRKVLHLFAYGGFADDEQILAWAEMPPGEAIVQMITFDTDNPLVSPDDRYDLLSRHKGTLTGLSQLWSSIRFANKMPIDLRKNFKMASHNSPGRTWLHAVAKRGLNPVRQKIGFMETNYHLVANLDAGVFNQQLFPYYDDIMNSLANHSSYQDVLAMAATSAAIAVQYNHKDNKFIDGKFVGNEDFAREYHQLFFGILGDYDPQYHEITTIRGTAKALTDMNVERIRDWQGNYYLSPEVHFGTEFHYPGSLEILYQYIDGETALEKISNLSQYTIVHQESLDNLPIMIVRCLADDNLDDEKISKIRTIWAELEKKDLLIFLRKYAISTIFHSKNRVKYWSSLDRNLIISNQLTLTNRESYLGYYYPEYYLRQEGFEIFRPVHNVFGHQTGLEASDEPSILKEAYNRSIDKIWFFARFKEQKDRWEKDWAAVIPQAEDTYRVRAVAEWLWNRFVADGLKNFGTLERAHVYALLGSGTDFGCFVNSTDMSFVYSSEVIETDPLIQELMGDLELTKINLDSDDAEKRRVANFRVGLAIGFISATPYVFVQEGI